MGGSFGAEQIAYDFLRISQMEVSATSNSHVNNYRLLWLSFIVIDVLLLMLVVEEGALMFVLRMR